MSEEPTFQGGRSVPHWHGFDHFHEHPNGDLMHGHAYWKEIAKRSKPLPVEFRYKVTPTDWLWVVATMFAIAVIAKVLIDVTNGTL